MALINFDFKIGKKAPTVKKDFFSNCVTFNGKTK